MGSPLEDWIGSPSIVKKRHLKIGVVTNELQARRGSKQFPKELFENWSNNKKVISIGFTGIFVQIGMINVYMCMME